MFKTDKNLVIKSVNEVSFDSTVTFVIAGKSVSIPKRVIYDLTDISEEYHSIILQSIQKLNK